MDFTYLIILAVVLILSPFVLKIASSQKKETKQQLKLAYLFILSAQIFLGFLGGVRVWLFLGITLIQILFVLNRQFTLAVILNFINTIVFFGSMIRLGQITGIQDSSFSSIATAFLVLIGNVIGLIFINKDKNLLKKYLR